MDTPLQCKQCGGTFEHSKCTKCGSHVAIAKSQFEGDQNLRSRLDGQEYRVISGSWKNLDQSPSFMPMSRSK